MVNNHTPYSKNTIDSNLTQDSILCMHTNNTNYSKDTMYTIFNLLPFMPTSFV